ncbi:MAG TPA: hypothetical protein P5298_15425 [Spirochaetia bacterium]|nr:hypothetical protein [Spirochaetia bacterium]
MKLRIDGLCGVLGKYGNHYRRPIRRIRPVILSIAVALSLPASCNLFAPNTDFVSFASVDSSRYDTRNNPSWEMSDAPDGRMYHIGRFWKSSGLFATELTYYDRSTMERESTLTLETYPTQSDYFAPLSTIFIGSSTLYMLRYDSSTGKVTEDRFSGVGTTASPVKTSRDVTTYATTYYDFKAQYFRDSAGTPTMAVKTADGLELSTLDAQGNWGVSETLGVDPWTRMYFYIEPSGVSLIAGKNGVYAKSHGGAWAYRSGIGDVIQFSKTAGGILATTSEGTIYGLSGTELILVREETDDSGKDLVTGMSLFHDDGSLVLLRTSPYYPPSRSVTSEDRSRDVVIIVGGTPTQHQDTVALKISADGTRTTQEIYTDSYVSETEPIQFRFSVIQDSYGHAVLPLYGQHDSDSINWKKVVVDWTK